MSTKEAKAAITVIMWVMLSIISVTAVAMSGSGNISDLMLLFMITFPPLIAAAATALMWIPEFRRSREDWESNQEKAKRVPDGQSRIDMLLAMMDEDEREAFKETLKAQVLRDSRREVVSEDGELPTSLAALIDAEASQQHYSS